MEPFLPQTFGGQVVSSRWIAVFWCLVGLSRRMQFLDLSRRDKYRT